ncbi:hypothetical protein EV363DRAFT_1325720, partial [Boletus edulis]
VHTLAFGQVAPAAAGVIHLGATSCCVTDNTDLMFNLPELGLGLAPSKDAADSECVLPPALRPLRLTGPVPVSSNSESEFAPVVVFVPDRGTATLPSHTHFRLHVYLNLPAFGGPLSRKLFGPVRRGVVFALDGMHGAASMWIPVWLSLHLSRRTRWVRNSTHRFPFRSWQMRNARSHTQAMFLFDSMGCKNILIYWTCHFTTMLEYVQSRSSSITCG